MARRLRMTLASFLIVYGASCAMAVTLLAVLVLSMMFGGFAGMLIAVIVCAIVGGFWAYLDDKRIEREYQEDTKCSQ